MKKNKIYVTTMYRWGDRNLHSYIVFAGFSKHKAINRGLQEAEDRGGKYSQEVLEFVPDEYGHGKDIIELKENGR